jgi:hypothetical protein
VASVERRGRRTGPREPLVGEPVHCVPLHRPACNQSSTRERDAPEARQVTCTVAAAGFSLFRRLCAPSLRSVTTLAVLLLLLTCINARELLATKVALHRDEILVMSALGRAGGALFGSS